MVQTQNIPYGLDMAAIKYVNSFTINRFSNYHLNMIIEEHYVSGHIVLRELKDCLSYQHKHKDIKVSQVYFQPW